METKINYPKIFFRFLKEHDIYEDFIFLMGSNSWRKVQKDFFRFVDPINYISSSFCDGSRYTSFGEDMSYLGYEHLIPKLIPCDFEWKILCYRLDENYRYGIEDFIKSRYFNLNYISEERYNEYKKFPISMY